MGKTGPFLFLERTSRCQPLQTEDNAKPCVRPPSRPGHTASLGVSQRVTPIQQPGPPGTHSQQEWRETGSRPASPPTPPPRVSGSTAAHFRSPLPGWDHTARCGLCLGRRAGWEKGEDARGRWLRPSPAWDEAWGLPCLGRPVDTPRAPRSRRVAAGPRPGLAPSPWRRVRQEPLRFVSRCFSHGRSASLLPPFTPPASLSIGETERRRRWVSGLATPRREDDVVPALPTRAASCASSGWGGPGGGMSPLAATSRSRDGLAWLGGRRLFSDPALPLER